mgnify:FL=1
MDIREVIFRIERERKEQNAIYHAAAAKFGLTDTELWVLYCISELDEDRTQQDLCRRGFYAKQTINTAITGLAKDGLVELIPIPGTRNHKRIHLTPAGRELAARTALPLKAAEEAAYGRFSEEELLAYLETVNKLNAYLREETEKL